MITTTTPAPRLCLTINGSKLAEGTAPSYEELQPALRSIALSDSPVIVRAPDEARQHLVEELHRLGRRAQLPIHPCTSAQEAEPLFDSLTARGETKPECLGTWALHDVGAWPRASQEKLSDLLEALDLGRLHGQLRHERIPRVVMLTSHADAPSILPSLARRIGYFNLTAVPTAGKES